MVNAMKLLNAKEIFFRGFFKGKIEKQ